MKFHNCALLPVFSRKGRVHVSGVSLVSGEFNVDVGESLMLAGERVSHIASPTRLIYTLVGVHVLVEGSRALMLIVRAPRSKRLLDEQVAVIVFPSVLYANTPTSSLERILSRSNSFGCLELSRVVFLLSLAHIPS